MPKLDLYQPQLKSLIQYTKKTTITSSSSNNSVVKILRNETKKKWKEEKKQTIERKKILERKKNTWNVIWVKTPKPPPGTEQWFDPKRGQRMNQKNFMWHGLLKKKIKVDKKLHFIT